MNHLIPVLLFFTLFNCCSKQKRSTVWTVKNVKTNYVLKGPIDKFDLPNQLKGKRVHIRDSFLILTEVIKKCPDLAMGDEFGDTIVFKKRVYFKCQKDDQLTLQYPGDEFAACVHANFDTCFVSETFLRFLDFKGKGIYGYISLFGKHSETNCILFVLKQNQQVVLFSENDFLLLFMVKENN